MPQLGQAMEAVEGRRPLARCRSWIAVGPAEFMFSPRRWMSHDSHMNALWVRRGKQNMAERVRKKKGEWPLHSGTPTQSSTEVPIALLFQQTGVIHVHDRHSADKGRTIMTTFTINDQNEIVAFATAEE